DRIVADDLGQDGCQQVDEGQHEQGAQPGRQGHDLRQYAVQQPVLVHGDADRQHAEDQRQYLPVDGLVGILHIQAAGSHHHGGGHDRQPLERHDTHGGPAHHRNDRRNGNGRLAPAVSPLLHGVEADQITVVGKLADLCGGAFHQHHVAELQLEIVQVVLDVFVLAVHGQHMDTVTGGQVEVAHRAVDIARAARHHCFGQYHVPGGNGLETLVAVELEYSGVAQLDEVTHAGMQDKTIPGLQGGGIERCGQLIVAAEDLQYLDSAVAVELGVGNGSVDHG